MLKRFLVACCSVVLLAAPVLASQAPAGQAPAGQSEFVPINEVPPADQLPAAPLLVTAYAFVWIALMIYLWSIWRRLSKVERELHALERRQSQRSGS
jgi:CcmD family protein